MHLELKEYTVTVGAVLLYDSHRLSFRSIPTKHPAPTASDRAENRYL